jgi:hypothetical protein
LLNITSNAFINPETSKRTKNHRTLPKKAVLSSPENYKSEKGENSWKTLFKKERNFVALCTNCENKRTF